MEWGFEHFYAIGLLVFFLLKAALVNRYQVIRAYNLYLNAAAFLGIAAFLGYQFWQDGLYMGIVALGLGGMAMGKYVMDMQVSKREEDDDQTPAR